MNEEKLRILKMVEEKKITAQQAEKLLEAMAGASSQKGGVRAQARNVVIRVQRDGKDKININVPFSWAKFGMPLLSKKIEAELRKEGIEFDAGEFADALSAGTARKLVEIEKEGKKVEISIE
jgi:DUF4097 and DUF4098 domain-containing protein YvlB